MSVKVYPPKKGDLSPDNPLPSLIQTPTGLALLELQGTINTPDTDSNVEGGSTVQIPIGRLDFPDYDPASKDDTDTAWMKRVYMYVGKHQRLTGEVKKLPKAVAVLRRRGSADGDGDEMQVDYKAEELDVVDIVKYKLVFSNRPEPVESAAKD
jgi:chromosome transmission fidelity protein 8